MNVLAHHALLVVAVACELAAGARIAARATERPLKRALAGSVLAAGLVLVQALALGLLGLADSSLILTAVAVLTYACARAALPAPVIGLRAALASWTGRLSPGGRAAAAGGAAFALAWMAWQLRHPYLAVDSLAYHLPLAAAWAQSGHPGALIGAIAGLPVASYPVSSEVLVSWVLAISHSWVVASLWTPMLLGVLIAGALVALRAWRVPPLVGGLALAAFCAQPLVLGEMTGPLTDLVTTAWLVAAVGLAAAARSRPPLLAVALVAAGLSFGTKTTPALLLVAALVTGARAAAGPELRRVARAWWPAVPLALAAGAVWATRNLVLHGSPLWPFVATSWGDPLPPAIAAVDMSFLDHPGAMLDGRVGDYLKLLAGGTVLLFGGMLAPAAARTRAVLVTAGLVALALLAWMNAPFTGIAGDTGLAVGATRYLLPGLATGALALALAARDAGPRARRALIALLGVALAASADRSWALPPQYVPPLRTLGVAVVVGVALEVGASALLSARPDLAGRLPALATPACAVALVVALSVAASGYVSRHASTGFADSGLLHAAQASPRFRDASFPIAMGPGTDALMRGDRLQHRIDFLGFGASCARVRRSLAAGWVVLQHTPPTAIYARLAGCLAGTRPGYVDGYYEIYGY